MTVAKVDSVPLADAPKKREPKERPALDFTQLELPPIWQTAARFAEAIPHAVALTAERHRDLFRQRDALVTTTRDPDRDGKRAYLRVIRLGRAGLRHRLMKAATFISTGKDGRPFVAMVSDSVLDSIFNDPTNWGDHFPTLAGVTDMPAVRRDGLLIPQGYDPVTQLLVDWGGIRFEPIGTTRADAEAAMARLRAIFAEFEFQGPLDESVTLSLMLAAVHRRLMRVSIAYLIDSPESDAGKSLIVDAMSCFIIGERAEAQTAPKEDDEFRKRVFSMLRAGERHIAFDNIAGKFGGESFDSLITAQKYADRVLGVSEIEKVDNTAIVTLTGRNVSFRGDGASRTARIRLLRPTRQTYTHEDLPRHIAENRHQLVSDCVTIVRAYLLSGRPNKSRLREFDDWCARAREPLIWLGMPDPAGAITLENDEAMTTYTELVRAWHDAYGTDPKVLARVLDDVTSIGGTIINPDKRLRLKIAIEELTQVDIDTKNIARIFSATIRSNMDRKTTDGTSFGVSDVRTNTGKCWAVTIHTPPAPAVAATAVPPVTPSKTSWDRDGFFPVD